MRRTFKLEEHPEFGNVGLAPTWMAGEQSDPLTGMGVAHDVLEHGNNDAVEWQGLGGSVYVRGRDYYSRRAWGNPNAEENIGSDFLNLFHLWRGAEIPEPPATRPLRNEEDEQLIQAAVQNGLALVRSELAGEEDAAEAVARWTSEAQRRRMVGWMRLGYRAATRRWRQHDRYMLLETFCAIEEKVDAFLKNAGRDYEGANATVVFDCSTARVGVHLDF